MTTCARSGRCSRAAADLSAHGLSARARSASSISGSRATRSRSAMARRAAAGSSSRAWATRAPAPARWSSPSRRRICWPGSRAVCGRWARCPRRWSGTASPACTPAAGARPRSSPRSAAQLQVDWHFCEPGDPQAKGVVERLQDFLERSFEPGRAFANELDFQLQLDDWFDTRANPRHHKTLRCRPIDRLRRGARGDGAAARASAGHRSALGAPGPAGPVPALRHLRLLARPGARRPPRRGPRHRREVPRSRWTPASSPAATSGRSPGTARSPRSSTPARCKRRPRRSEPVVEIRPLARYDALIA